MPTTSRNKYSPSQSTLLEPLYFFDKDAVERFRYARCDICDEKCHAVQHHCTSCVNFDVCVACFKAPNFEHAKHQFVEIDLAYLINKFREKGLWGKNKIHIFVRPDVVCYTCFDHQPGRVRPALWINEEERVLDSNALSENQYLVWKSLESDTTISRASALFLLDRHNWNKEQAIENFNADFKRHPRLYRRDCYFELEKDTWMSQHLFNMSDLARSAEKGCQICSLIYRGLATASPSMVSSDHRIQMALTPTHIRTNGTREDNPMLGAWAWYFNKLPGAKPPWSSIKAAPEYSDDFESEQSFDTLRAWIQDCDTHHSHQYCTGTNQTLPRRLLFISDWHENNVFRLVEVPEQEKGRYIALSHCWGTSKNLRTTKSNLDAMYENVRAGDLPKTFLDAALCARKLGIKYVWIDSLCIIQDDASDWERESAMMCDYYQNAWLVVVAAGAQDDTCGFLGKRLPVFQGIPLQSKEGSGKYDICIRREFPHIRDDTYPGTELHGDFTNSRAWCLQETFLARRTVTFHGAEMVWSCYTVSKCECGSAGEDVEGIVTIYSGQVRELGQSKVENPRHHYRPRDFSGPRFSDSSRSWICKRRPFTRLTSSANLHEAWRVMVVPAYSKRLLTHRGDRLPAISGLAAVVAAQEKSSYLAGIWSRDIQLGLLWEIEGRAERAAHTNPAAPSFSWASVDQPVLYRAPGFVVTYSVNSALGDINVKLLGFSMELSGSSEFGSVTGGYVKLSGLVSQVTLTWKNNRYEIQTKGGPKLFISPRGYQWSMFQPDTLLGSREIEDSDGSTSFTMYRSDVRITWPDDVQFQVDCLVVADIQTPFKPPVTATVDEKCEEFAVIILGKIELVNGLWFYQRLGKAALVFKPDDGTNWLTQANRRELFIR